MNKRLTLNRFISIAFGSILILVSAGWYARSVWSPSIADLRQQTREAIEAKDWVKAETLATKWATHDPNSGEPWLRLADSMRRQHKYRASLASLTHIPATVPEAETGLLAQMELQFGPLNQPAEAAETCERIIEANPASSIARQRLIFFLALTLQRTRLIDEIRSAIRANCEPIEAYVYFFFADSLMFSNGTELNSRWLLGEPDSEMYEVGEAVFTAESLDLSVVLDDRDAALKTRHAAARKAAVMQALLAKYPHNSELLAYNIRQNIQSGYLADVVNLLAQATVEAEVDHRFWRFKGWVHVQRSESSEAEQSYRKAIELNPMDWSTRNLLAELLQQQERSDEVKTLRDLVARGNDLRLELQRAPNARQVPPDVLRRLASYAADCGDQQISEGLLRRISQTDHGRGS